jgi:hypothetical protein
LYAGLLPIFIQGKESHYLLKDKELFKDFPEVKIEQDMEYWRKLYFYSKNRQLILFLGQLGNGTEWRE